MGRVPKEISVDFQSGLNSVLSPLSGGNSLRLLNNVRLAPGDEGALECMPGYSKVNSSEITGTPTFHSFGVAIKSDGTRMNVIGYTEAGGDDYIIHMNPDGTTDTILKTGDAIAPTKGDFSLVVLDDLAFFFNGTDTPFKSTIATSGQTVTAQGVTRPSITNASLSLNAGGNNAVEGIVNYFISQVTGTTEGALSAAIDSTGIDCGNGNRVDVDLSHADFGANTYNVYRTVANGVEPRFVSQVTGGATYTDDTPDRELGDLPYLNGDPPPAEIISAVVYQDRIWGLTKDGKVYWTDIENPESWATSTNGNVIPVNEDDGDFGVALGVDPSGLVVFKENHIYRIIGSTPADARVAPVTLATQENRSVGLASANAMVAVDQAIFFYWDRRVYIISGGFVQQISGPIEDDLSSIATSDEADGVYLGHFPKRRHLYVSVPLSSGGPTHTYLFDLKRQQWIGRMTVGFRGFLSTVDGSGDEEFWGLSADTSAGFVYKLEDGQTYAGTAINASATLPVFFGRTPSQVLNFLYVEPEFEPKASGSFNVKLTLDGKSSDTDEYSVSQVEAATDRWSRRVNYARLGRQLDININSNADQPAWKVYRVNAGAHAYRSVSR